jgi:hypothetical protein
VSFREIAVTIGAVNRASSEFQRIQSDAETLAVRVKTLGSVLAGLGATGAAIGHIAHRFGLLKSEQARAFNSGMMVVSILMIKTLIAIELLQMNGHGLMPPSSHEHE